MGSRGGPARRRDNRVLGVAYLDDELLVIKQGARECIAAVAVTVDGG